MDQTNMPEVVGHFINKERGTLSMDSGVSNVLLDKFRQFLIGQFFQDLRILTGVTLSPSPAQVLGQGQDVRQLQCAINLRMGRQNLLQ